MAHAGDGERQLNEAQDNAAGLIALVRAWIPKRRLTIQTLTDIAAELDNVQENVNISKIAGYAASILGGAAGVAGIFLTGGLATPLIVGGAISAVAGAATTTGATLIGDLVSNGKLQKAQEALDADKALVIQIEEKQNLLATQSMVLSPYFRLQQEQMFGLLIISALSGNILPNVLRLDIARVALPPEVASLNILAKSMGNVGKGFASALAEISLKGLLRVVGSVLVVALGSVLIVWDAINLVKTIGDLSKGSKTALSRNLRDIAGNLETQTRELERMLEQAQQHGQDFETMIKKQFRKRLRAISKKGNATLAEADEVYNYLCTFTTSEWQNIHFVNARVDLMNFVFWIARVFHLIYNRVEEYKRTRRPEGELTVILIAHGDINTTLMLPVGLYYPTAYMKAVTLYEPWGCSIDASVVYGIAVNSIRINDVAYTGQVYRNQTPEMPTDWNCLPRSEAITIPSPTLYPLAIGEQAFMELIAIQQASDGLVLPYFTLNGNDIWPFPEVPLFVITTVLGLIGFLTTTYIKLRVAACLSVADNDIARINRVINCPQYYVVSPNQNVSMTNRPIDQAQDIGVNDLNNLNQYL